MLFISHDASRTGAPIVLLTLLRWIKANTDLPFDVLLRCGGELEPEFDAIARVSILDPQAPRNRELGRGLLRRAGFPDAAVRRHRRRLAARIAARGISLVYSNTITNGDALDLLAGLGCPVVTNVHELETVIRAHGTANLESVKRYTHRYVAGSEAVRANLVARHGIVADRIDVVREFVPVSALESARSGAGDDAVMDLWGVPRGAQVVGASGTTAWNKGPDLFIHLAQRVQRRRPGAPIHFVWVGGAGAGSQRFDELQHDVDAAGLTPFVHFVGAVPDPLAHFARFDVFALVSREDAFPLVCLESALLGKPILCFAGAGGEPEFVGDDCGFVVPYLDLDAMADRALQLLDSEELRRRTGQRAAQKVREHHDVAVVGPRILRLIAEVIDRDRAGRA